jgi:hypothetical protein
MPSMRKDKRWDDLKAFLVRTGDEIRREVEKLVVEVRDPDKAQRVRVALQQLATWARATAEEVATRIDQAVKRGKSRRKPAPVERKTEGKTEAKPAASKAVPSKPPKARSGGRKASTSAASKRPRAPSAKPKVAQRKK